MTSPHPVSSLDSADQVEPLPHVHVAVERTRVGELVPGGCHAQDGLQVACSAEDTALGCQRVSTQRPELRREGGDNVDDRNPDQDIAKTGECR